MSDEIRKRVRLIDLCGRCEGSGRCGHPNYPSCPPRGDLLCKQTCVMCDGWGFRTNQNGEPIYTIPTDDEWHRLHDELSRVGVSS